MWKFVEAITGKASLRLAFEDEQGRRRVFLLNQGQMVELLSQATEKLGLEFELDFSVYGNPGQELLPIINLKPPLPKKKAASKKKIAVKKKTKKKPPPT